MTIIDEMENFDLYNKMPLVEFYEFLARVAHLIFEDTPSLLSKLEKLLMILLPAAKQEYKPFDADNDIESESDYDDDLVDQII